FNFCRYCQKHLVGGSSSATKHLSNHVMHCLEAQALKRSRGETEPAGGELENPSFVFDNGWSREDFAKMLLSRNIVKLDCMQLYAKEKEKVYSLESLHCRVSLTLDMWTSIGNNGYMCLTCHYIDDDWNLKKKVLNFEYVEAPHGHKELTKVLLDKLLEWNIDKKLFSILLDNSNDNNKVVKMLLNDPNFTQFLPLNGSWFHWRCGARILNLIVQDCLKEVEEVIFKVCESVKYVRSSQQRKENFKKVVRFEVCLKKSLILDVSTRWNSTYIMLERAAGFEKVFSCFQGPSFQHPIFFFWDIYIIHISLKQWCIHEESFISLMASRMLLKFDKYWSKTNILLTIATILNPQFKMFMVRYFFEKIYDDEAAENVEEVKIGLQHLYDTYVTRKSDNSFDSITLSASSSIAKKIDLDVYLEEPAKPEDNLDVLKWWKSNSSKYLVLSHMARDVLAIPVSTVASESTFSAGSRVLNKYRSSLDDTIVQALICTENWLWDDVSSIYISEEDVLSSIFASSKIIDENEDEILEFPYDEAFAFSSASD
ncbi:hypothetical protein Taro_040426, partial [Colocasia esculenta]|nr:hypothetical protein [Colocasia esculenta]